MLKQNSELRAEARAALTDKWVMAAIATLIYSAVVGGLSAIPVVGILILLLTLPIAYGYAIVILDVFRGSDVNIGGLFDGFSDYGRIIGTKLLQAVDLVAGYSGYYQVLFVCNDRFYLERSTRIG